LSLAAAAYAIGWIQAHAYFKEFGGEWLLSQLGSVHFVQYSLTPVLGVAFLTWLLLMELARADEGNYSMQVQRFLLNHGWLIAAILVLSSWGLERLQWNKSALIMIFLSGFTYALFAAACIAQVILLFRNGRFVGDLFDARIAFSILFVGAYLLPNMIGRNEARRDRDPTRSRLPIVEASGLGMKDPRLLSFVGNTVYIVDIADSKARILFLPASDIKAIVEPTRK
jgi:hypothetical protein